jgi:hypothetical protein
MQLLLGLRSSDSLQPRLSHPGLSARTPVGVFAVRLWGTFLATESIDVWCLVFGASLVLGAWNLELFSCRVEKKKPERKIPLRQYF